MKKILVLAAVLVLFATSALAEDVQVSWTAPDDSRVVGYNVYWGLANPPETVIDAGANTECIIPDLTVGEEIYIGATSYDADGTESAMSDILHYTVEAKPKVKEIPRRPVTITIVVN